MNLFITVKKRDLIYRILCTPKDFLNKAINYFSRLRRQNIALFILLIPVWLLASRIIILGLILWFALVWPITKVYEYLTIGDIRARAGEIGVRQGGFLGYRKWPLKVRLCIFGVVLVSFWGALALICMNHGGDNGLIGSIFGVLVLICVLTFWVRFLNKKIKDGVKAKAARKRARQMQGVFPSENKL